MSTVEKKNFYFKLKNNNLKELLREVRNLEASASGVKRQGSPYQGGGLDSQGREGGCLQA